MFRKRGFTILELFVAIGILSILISILLPAINAARESARRLECANRMRQIAIALLDYKLMFRYLPRGTSGDQTNTPWRGWLVNILPSLEARQAYLESEVQFGIAMPFQSHSGFRMHFSKFVCPSDGRLVQERFAPRKLFYVALSSYLGVNGLNDLNRDGVLFINSRVADRDVADGLSQTFMFVERPPSTAFDYGWWYAGTGVERRGTLDHTMGIMETSRNRFATCLDGQWAQNLQDECSSNHFWSLHGNFANTSFCDGAIQSFSFRDLNVTASLATRCGDDTPEISSY